MPTIKIKDHAITYSLRIDKRRKTIQLRLLPSTVVEIVAPKKLSVDEIKQILTSKSRWLIGRLDNQAALAANPINQSLLPGSQILYLGQPYTLKVLPGKSSKPEVIVKSSEIHVLIPASELNPEQSVITEHIVKAWLVNQAGEYFLARTKHWAPLIGVHPVRITIRDQKTRWGSCSSLGNINYNWRVIMAPPRIVDYLVIHELSHLLEPNHSAKFWNEVKKFAPDYQECRKWLTANGKILSRIF